MRGKAGFFAGVSPSVALLLHFDGDDEDTTTTDSSSFGRSVTLGGNAMISTAQSKFGGSSLLLDGTTTSKVSVPSEFRINERDWTVDAWVRWDAANSGPEPIICEFGDHTDDGVRLFLAATLAYDPILDDNVFEWRPAIGTGNIWEGASAAVLPDIWTHVAWTSEDGLVRFFVDGVASGDATLLTIPSDAAVTIGPDFAGHIDELRIVVGKAEWTASFTPPTTAYL